VTEPSDLRRQIVSLLNRSAELKRQAHEFLMEADALRLQAEALQDAELRRQADRDRSKD
jgi:hypothetical protein